MFITLTALHLKRGSDPDKISTEYEEANIHINVDKISAVEEWGDRCVIMLDDGGAVDVEQSWPEIENMIHEVFKKRLIYYPPWKPEVVK